MWQGGAALQQAASAPWQQPPTSHEQAANGSAMPWQSDQLQQSMPQTWAQAQPYDSARPWLPRPGGSVQSVKASSVQMQRPGTISQGVAAQPPLAALQGHATNAPTAAGKAAGPKVSPLGCWAHGQLHLMLAMMSNTHGQTALPMRFQPNQKL